MSKDKETSCDHSHLDETTKVSQPDESPSLKLTNEDGSQSIIQLDGKSEQPSIRISNYTSKLLENWKNTHETFQRPPLMNINGVGLWLNRKTRRLMAKKARQSK